MKLAMVDLKKQYSTIKQEIDAAVSEVIESTHFILGEQVAQFEEASAKYIGSKYAVACANGTEALQIAMMAMGIKPGDEVITSPFTFVATCETVALLGAKPVYVDIDPKTFNIDVSKIEAAITPKTKAIIPVHLFGQCADMDPLMEIARKHNLYVIEDMAQAFGAEYKGRKAGSIGHFAATSFFPSKNLGGYGDSGMVFVQDDELHSKVRMVMNHGSRIRYKHEILGLNSRMDTLQAAILLVKIKYIDQWNKARANNAALYSGKLKDAGVITPYTAEFTNHIYHQYSMLVEDRQGLLEALNAKGIPTGVYYPIPLHKQPAFLEYGHGVSLPVAEATAEKILSLPMYPELTEEEITYITDAIKDFTGKK